MIRWAAYWLMAVSLAAAVFLNGGAHPHQWQWTALGVSLGAILALLHPEDRNGSPSEEWGWILVGLLAAWMFMQWLPLPPLAVKRLAPDHWSAIVAARAVTGHASDDWASLSFAPAMTLERLLNVFPAMAAFLAAQAMAGWWRQRLWIAIAPVVAIAWPESLLGIAQFYVMRTARGQSDPATGTYIYHNHFSGLLEIAFPLALAWGIWVWRQSEPWRHKESLGRALKTVAILGVAACLLAGIVTSLSRMGFLSVIAASVFTGVAVLLAARGENLGPRRWLWAIPVAAPLLILALVLPPNELMARFDEITTDPDMTIHARTDIWRDTAQEIAASRWTGVGLGAYEHGLYRFKTAAPANTVDFAHNDYLQILAELGIPGAILAAALGAWILLRCWSAALHKSLNWEFAVGLLGALFTVGLHSLADFNIYSPANALALAWIGGVAVSSAFVKA